MLRLRNDFDNSTGRWYYAVVSVAELPDRRMIQNIIC